MLTPFDAESVKLGAAVTVDSEVLVVRLPDVPVMVTVRLFPWWWPYCWRSASGCSNGRGIRTERRRHSAGQSGCRQGDAAVKAVLRRHRYRARA